MCTVCGCGSSPNTATQAEKPADHHHPHPHDSGTRGSHHHYGNTAAGVSVAGFDDTELITIEMDILSKNDVFASANRQRFAELGVLALNLVSSPGAGKTTLLEKSVAALTQTRSVGVIEGDQQTSNDAERIRALDVAAVQINTGRGCHLDARMVSEALDDLRMAPDGVVFIENVGNLVCPAAFDLGEACKVVILSVTEGDDKPLKYPDMFAAAELLVLSKIDLVPHVDFDVARVIERAHRINPDLDVIEVSARHGTGMDQWLGRIEAMVARLPGGSTAAAAGRTFEARGSSPNA